MQSTALVSDDQVELAPEERPLRPHLATSSLVEKRAATALQAGATAVGRQATSAAELPRLLAALESAPVFFQLPDPVLRRLARRLRFVDVPRGTLIAAQGEKGDTLFIIESGSCQLRTETGVGSSMALLELRAGELVGEQTCVSDDPYQVSVLALEDSVLLALDRQSLYEVVPPGSSVFEDLTRLSEQRQFTYREYAVRPIPGRLQRASLVAVYSAKGGTGRTTLAVNLAAQLARRHPGEVVLLDLALPYNNAALMTAVTPANCLARLARVPVGSFPEAVMSSLIYHPSGMLVLPTALRLEDADDVNPDLAARALEVLESNFRFVIADTAVAMTDVNLAVFERARRVLMLATPEVTSVKGTSEALAVMERIFHIPMDRVTLVLNRREPRAQLTRQAVERTLGMTAAVELPYDGKRRAQAALRGEILSLSDPKSQITIAAAKLADIVAADPVPVAGGGQ
jgi:Flp pilus assembly CpaE family ATPase